MAKKSKQDEKTPIEIVDDFKKESQAYKKNKQFEPVWQEAERFYNNDQWKYSTKRFTKNWCFTIVESEVPILTDSRPSTDIIPRQPEQQEDAKVLSSALEWVYDDQRLSLKVPMAVRSSLITGNGWMYVDWDPDQEDGQGKVVLKNLHWKLIDIDPSATEIDEARYVIISFPMDKEELKRKYPHKSSEIDEMAAGIKNDFTDSSTSVGIDPEKWKPGWQDQDQEERYSLDNMVLLEEAWITDYSMEKIDPNETTIEIAFETEQFMNGENPDIGKFEDHKEHIKSHKEAKVQIIAEALQIQVEELTEDDLELVKEDPELAVIMAIIDDHIEMHESLLTQNPESKRPKYKNNKRLILKSGKIVFYDGEPDIDDGKVPLVPFYCYKTENSIYADGELKNIIPVQKSYNEMDNAEREGLLLNGNSGWIKENNSGVDSASLTNRQGLVITVNPGTKVERLQPAQISPQFAARMQSDQAAIEGISGVNEATQGKRPSGVTAASAIKFLQEQSVGRIRLKTRQLEEYSLLRMGQLVTSRIVKYWSTERTLRVYDNGGKIQFVDFDPEKIQELDYEIKMVPGSTAGLDKESIFTLMKELAEKQVIDPKTFIEATDMPYKTKILENIEARDELTAVLQQLQAENEELKAALGVPSELPQAQIPQGQ